MLTYSTFRHNHHHHIDKCASRSFQLDMTIHRVPGKSNVVAIAFLHYLDLAAVVGLVKSTLLTLIYKA